jgi:hypothetical protein
MRHTEIAPHVTENAHSAPKNTDSKEQNGDDKDTRNSPGITVRNRVTIRGRGCFPEPLARARSHKRKMSWAACQDV